MENLTQILWLVPNYYLYRWEYRSSTKQHELVIEIPLNALDLALSDAVPSQEPFEGKVHSTVLEARKTGFRQALL